MAERPVHIRELLAWLRSHRVVAISAANAVVVLALTCSIAAILETSATREVHAEVRNRPRAVPTLQPTAAEGRGPARSSRGSDASPVAPNAAGQVEVRTRRVPRAAPPEPPLTPDEDPDARLEGPPEREMPEQ